MTNERYEQLKNFEDSAYKIIKKEKDAGITAEKLKFDVMMKIPESQQVKIDWICEIIDRIYNIRNTHINYKYRKMIKVINES